MEGTLDKEFDDFLEACLAECTNDKVQRFRRFVAGKKIGFLDLMKRFLSVDATEERGVHLLYALNDILHHRDSEWLDSKDEFNILKLFEQKWSECPENHAQLTDLVKVWEDRKYLSNDTLRLLHLTAIPIILPKVFGIPDVSDSEQPASLIIPAIESGSTSLQPIENLKLSDAVKSGLIHFYSGLNEEYEFTEQEVQPTRTYFGWTEEFEDKYIEQEWFEEPKPSKRYNAFPPPENY